MTHWRLNRLQGLSKHLTIQTHTTCHEDAVQRRLKVSP